MSALIGLFGGAAIGIACGLTKNWREAVIRSCIAVGCIVLGYYLAA